MHCANGQDHVRVDEGKRDAKEENKAAKKPAKTKKGSASKAKKAATAHGAFSVVPASSKRRSSTAAQQKDNDHFWRNVINAVNAEPREHASIKGASGVEHRMLGLGVDDKGKRLILISDEPDARTTAMMQVDVSATLPDMKVIVARPVAANLAQLAQALVAAAGTERLGMSHIAQIGEKGEQGISAFMEPLAGGVFAAYQAAPLSFLKQLQQLMVQLAVLDWSTMAHKEEEERYVDIGQLARTDVTLADRELGVCPIPLYGFSEDEMEAIRSGSNVDDVKESLKTHSILQYFFPPSEQTALGLIERGITKETKLIETLGQAQTLGHPLAEMDLTGKAGTLRQTIETLQDYNMIVEVDYGFEVTPAGETVRLGVKGTPRESFLAKLLCRIMLNVNLGTQISPFDDSGGSGGSG